MNATSMFHEFMNTEVHVFAWLCPHWGFYNDRDI